MIRDTRELVVILVLASGCGDDGGPTALEPPTCEADSVLRYVHDLGGTLVTDEIADASYAFGNAQTTAPGTFDISDRGNRTDRIHVEFTKALLRPGMVQLRGFFDLDGVAAGNCETDLNGTLVALDGEGWTFQLVDLREGPPYCEGAPIAGSFAACVTPRP